MRSRILSFKNKVMSSIPAVSIGAGLAGGMYIYKCMKDDEEINVNLPTFVDMREYRDHLRQVFFLENDEDEFGLKKFDALLLAIQINDDFSAKLQLDDLVDKNMVSDVIRDRLIVVAANYNKIKILELLQSKFGDQAVLRNRHARELLSLSDGDKQKVTKIVEQPYQSPGKINIDGLAVIIRVEQKKMLEENLRLAFQPVYITCDLLDDITQSCLRVIRARKDNDELREKFSRTIIIDLFDHPEYEKTLEDYYRRLSVEANQLNKPVVGTVLLTGGHFTIAQIKVTPQADNFTHAAIVYIDPQGSNLSATSCTYAYIASLPHHVFSRVKLMFSDEINQFAPLGCSLFVCDQYGTLMNLDRIMSHNTQYSFAGNKDVIFDYAEHHKILHTTLQLQYGYDHCVNDHSYAGVNDFQLFVLPVCLIAGKQSLEGIKLRKDMTETYVLQPNGRYECDFGSCSADARTSVLGLMGINRARSNSSPERQSEFKMPAGVSGDETVDDVIAKNVEPAYPGANHMWNKRNARLGYEFGHSLGENIRVVLNKQ